MGRTVEPRVPVLVERDPRAVRQVGRLHDSAHATRDAPQGAPLVVFQLVNDGVPVHERALEMVLRVEGPIEARRLARSANVKPRNLIGERIPVAGRARDPRLTIERPTAEAGREQNLTLQAIEQLPLGRHVGRSDDHRIHRQAGDIPCLVSMTVMLRLPRLATKA